MMVSGRTDTTTTAVVEVGTPMHFSPSIVRHQNGDYNQMQQGPSRKNNGHLDVGVQLTTTTRSPTVAKKSLVGKNVTRVLQPLF